MCYYVKIKISQKIIQFFELIKNTYNTNHQLNTLYLFKKQIVAQNKIMKSYYYIHKI